MCIGAGVIVAVSRQLGRKRVAGWVCAEANFITAVGIRTSRSCLSKFSSQTVLLKASGICGTASGNRPTLEILSCMCTGHARFTNTTVARTAAATATFAIARCRHQAALRRTVQERFGAPEFGVELGTELSDQTGRWTFHVTRSPATFNHEASCSVLTDSTAS